MPGKITSGCASARPPNAKPPNLRPANPAMSPATMKLTIAGRRKSTSTRSNPARQPSAEPQLRALPRLLGLDLAVAGRGLGVQRRQQPARRGRHFRDSAVEGVRVGLRRLVEARKLAHELQRGGLDLVLGRRRLEIEQRLDVAAHLRSPLPGPRGGRADGFAAGKCSPATAKRNPGPERYRTCLLYTS